MTREDDVGEEKVREIGRANPSSASAILGLSVHEEKEEEQEDDDDASKEPKSRLNTNPTEYIQLYRPQVRSALMGCKHDTVTAF